MADDNIVDNPLTNTCRIFTQGHCNLEEQLDEAKAENESLKRVIDGLQRDIKLLASKLKQISASVNDTIVYVENI